MIKFFRRIRQQLLSENKFSKYVLYAIGEIILVMIGILLALQVNNWNESRRERKEEIQLLNELKNALHYDLKNTFPPLRNRAQSRAHLAIKVLEDLKAGTSLNDTINFRFLSGGETFNPSYSAYKSLESKGIDIIKNDAIKYGITDIYDVDYVNLKTRLEQNTFANLRDFNRPFLFDNFKLKDDYMMVPKQPELLLNSDKFKFILFKTHGSDQATINQLGHLELKIKKIINQIDNEIQE